VEYALQHPEVRHLALPWRILDGSVCAVWPASVYRVLREANLVCRRKPQAMATGQAMDRIIHHYKHERLHSSLSFLRPVDFYRGKPEGLLAERVRKL